MFKKLLRKFCVRQAAGFVIANKGTNANPAADAVQIANDLYEYISTGKSRHVKYCIGVDLAIGEDITAVKRWMPTPGNVRRPETENADMIGFVDSERKIIRATKKKASDAFEEFLRVLMPDEPNLFYRSIRDNYEMKLNEPRV